MSDRTSMTSTLPADYCGQRDSAAIADEGFVSSSELPPSQAITNGNLDRAHCAHQVKRSGFALVQ